MLCRDVCHVVPFHAMLGHAVMLCRDVCHAVLCHAMIDHDAVMRCRDV
jgi:hypothetical protein